MADAPERTAGSGRQRPRARIAHRPGAPPPDTRLLRELVQLAAGVLPGTGAAAGQGRVQDVSFVRQGGDSLLAMHLAAEAERRLGVTLPVGALLADRPLPQLLSEAASCPPPAGPAPPAGYGPGSSPERSAAGLSAAQRGMWLREHVVGSSPYNLVFIGFADGPLRPDLLAAAIAATVDRHEGLRTCFPEAAGAVERKVLGDFTPLLEQFRAGGGEGFADHVRTVAARHGRLPLDLSGAPPLRLILVSDGGKQHALILIVHHILLDGWAIGLVFREIFARYDELERGRDLDLGPGRQFREYLAWQERLRAAGELGRQASFWDGVLSEAPKVLDLPADRARPSFPDPRGARCPFDLGPELTVAIRARARQLGMTPAAFLLAALGLTLCRYTAAGTMVIGMPVAGRATPQIAELVAVTTNLVPVRIDVREDEAGSDYLLRVQDSLAASLDNSALPFAELVARCGAAGTLDRHPLVQVAFGVHDSLIPERISTGSLDVRIEEGHGGGAQFDLEVFVQRSDPSFAGCFEYATSVWNTAEAAGFGADLTAALHELAASPSRAVQQIRCIAPARRAFLDRLNGTARHFPASSVDELFRAQAARTPDAVAVRDGDRVLTYAELASAAASQAARLAAAGVTPGSTVLVTAQRSAAEVVAVLGILWAGAAYVAVAEDSPPGRVAQLVSVLRPAAVIGSRPLPPGCPVPRVPACDEVSPGPGQSALAPLPPDPERLAYVAFTSGSTGVPKGVCIPHRGVARLAGGLGEYCPVGPGDRMLRFSSLSFDASTLEIWGALLTGATVVVHPPGLPSPAELGRFISESGVTVAWLTAGLFRLVGEFSAASLAGVRHLLTGGDVVPPGQVRQVLQQNPGLVIVNGYGPTENTTFTTVHSIAHPSAVEDPLPIGTPVAGTQVYVLDRHRRLVPPGAAGELYVAGAGLAAGYYGDEAQTTQCFGTLSEDIPARLYRTGDLARFDTRGRLQFLGRTDDQVKIRGFRVELGEVRSALAAHPGVSDVFVTVTGDHAADKRLLAACVPADRGLSTEELAGFVSARLPGYMVPSLWTVVPQFPVTPNGKIDRAALRRAARPAAGTVSQHRGHGAGNHSGS